MKALKPTVPILLLLGDDPLREEKLKLVEAFLFKADSIPVLFSHGQNAIEQMPRCATYVRNLRSDQCEEERILDDGLHMTAHAAAA